MVVTAGRLGKKSDTHMLQVAGVKRLKTDYKSGPDSMHSDRAVFKLLLDRDHRSSLMECRGAGRIEAGQMPAFLTLSLNRQLLSVSE